MFLLTKKSEVFSTFSNFKTQLEILLSVKIKMVCTDGGGEFVNSQFKEFFQQASMIHQFVCPHTPAQNVVVEHKNQHIVEIVVALLQIASMPLMF